MKKIQRGKKRDLKFRIKVTERVSQGAAMKSKSSSQQCQRSKG